MKKASILIYLSLLSLGAFSQTDAHYWTHQFGAKGLLLNGAVISSADDETSIFYNPGAIVLDENLGFAFSFLSPTYANLNTENFLGNGNIISDEGFDFSPGFLAFRYSPTKRLVLGVASFTRFESGIRYEDRVADQIDNGSIFVFRSDLEFVRKKSEDWFGIAVGYKLTDNLGIGISQFSVWHNQNLDFGFKKEILLSQSPESIFQSWRAEIDYDLNLTAAWISKIGLSFRNDKLGLGLTLTTPNYGAIRSTGSYNIDDQRFNVLNNTNDVISDRSEVDEVQYKSPLSVGFGIDFKLGKYKLYWSGEYFSTIDNYDLFEVQSNPLEGIAAGASEIDFNLETANQSVVNIGFGMQYEKSENLTVLAGFRTDFNESSDLSINDQAIILSSTPDVFHISGGLMYEYKKNIFSIGIDLGYGKRFGGPQLTDLSNITAQNIFTYSGNNSVNTSYYSAMLFITYDFIFNRIADTFEGKDKPE